VATTQAACSPISRQLKPQMIAPTRGAKEEDRFHLPQPFITLTSSTAIVPRLRKKQTRIARPMAASAAATVRMNSVKT
jgi:hypothetical protein